MNLEEIIKKYIEAKELMEGNDLLVAAGFVTVNGNEELREAELLLAKTTKASADVLARTTQVSADLLAKTTEKSAEEIKIINEISVKWMKWLTVALIIVGFIQILIAIVTLLKV